MSIFRKKIKCGILRRKYEIRKYIIEEEENKKRIERE
jgi:hypothetical protein